MASSAAGAYGARVSPTSSAADGAAGDGAAIIASTYETYLARLHEVIDRAKTNFERQDWRAVQRDSAYRLDLYNVAVQEGLARLRELLGPAAMERATWAALRAAYAPRVASRTEPELAETFFNSHTRRLFHTIGVDPTIEFVSPAVAAPSVGPPWSHTVVFTAADGTEAMVRAALEAFPFEPGYDDLTGDAGRIARAVAEQRPVESIRSMELARPVFYRGKGAYLVGTLRGPAGVTPLLIALTNARGRVAVDAVLITADEVSIVFSFARSYFFVHAERPREMVDFLRSIMPRKSVSELYNALGFDKHGKTELYRSILHHLETSDDRFEIAAGQRGMVMSVFTLPGFDLVFKVIRDRFDYPKTVTHDEVRAKYRLVFHHDRAGRLVDAQEFEHLAFDRRRFDPRLLDELLGSCAERVALRGDQVVIAHLYTERRLRPLDVYLREAGAEAAREAVVDYGQALRDLAATNVFPGDMLLKNFGVSRHGRLIFYDYDELVALTDCRFRKLPSPREDHDEGAADPWFYVGERDIFPEEFRAFLGLPGDLLETFLTHHKELLDVPFWQRMQELHRNGEVLDIYPYRSARRLRPTPRRPRQAGASQPS